MFTSSRLRIQIATCKPRWIVISSLFLLSLLAIYIAIYPYPYPFINLNEKRWLGLAGDHWLHFLYFSILTTTLPWCTSPALSWWYPIPILAMATIGSEWIQSWFPWKQFDWWDVVANVIGLLVGAITAISLEKIVSNPNIECQQPIERKEIIPLQTMV